MNETRRHQQMILLGFLSAVLPWERDELEKKNSIDDSRAAVLIQGCFVRGMMTKQPAVVEESEVEILSLLDWIERFLLKLISKWLHNELDEKFCFVILFLYLVK